MASTEFVWTVVPGGSDPADGDVVTLNVHVSMALHQEPGDSNTLADHPEFLGSVGGTDVVWPPDPDLAFDIILTDPASPAIPITIPGVSVDVTAYDRAYFAAVFSATTRIEGFRRRNLAGHVVHTYPAAKLAQSIREIYVAAFPDGLGRLPTGAGLLGSTDLDLMSFRGRVGDTNRKRAQQQLADALGSAGVVDTTAGPPDPTFDVFQALDFFAPSDQSVFTDGDGNPIPSADPRFTFDEALVGLNAEPPLQRLFGLVFSLRLSRTDDLGRIAGLTEVGIQARPVSAQLSTATHRMPRTRATYDHTPGGAFAPAPASTLLADGYLAMEPAANLFTVSGVDPTDAIKLSTAAGNVEVNQGLPEVTQPGQEPLPALRSGVFLSQDGLAKDLKQAFDATPPTSADVDGMDLWAEDLMKGFCLDIRHHAAASGEVGPWRSEAVHTARYTFDTDPALDLSLPVEEGHSSRGVTQRLDGDDLYVSEVIYPWEGFPAGLPLPGRALNSDPADPQQAVDPDVNPDGAPTGDLPYEISHGRPDPGDHQFTRLLCGDAYQFRARVRWIDGTNLPPADTDDSHATAPHTHRRTEPVPPHDIFPTQPYVPGEGASTIVLRGTPDAEQPFAQRILLPKRVAFTDVMRTRLLDIDAGGGRTTIDRSSYADLAARDAFDYTPGTPGVTAMPLQPDQVHLDPDAFPAAPVLPDPMVAGLAVHLVDGGPATVQLADGATYPAAQTFLVRVVQGSAVTVAATDNVVTFTLRPGDRIRAAHSAMLDPALASWMAILDWVGPGGWQPSDIAAGRHTAITPWNDLVLIHAVRQPLAPAVIPERLDAAPVADLRLIRRKGGTWVQLQGTLPFNRRSTDQVDITARWEEYVDTGEDGVVPTSQLVPPGERRKDAAVTISIRHDNGLGSEGLDDDALTLGEHGTADRIEFGDTRHRHLWLGTRATSRYAEHFTQRWDGATWDLSVAEVTIPGLGPDGVLPGWTSIRVPVEGSIPDPANPADRVETLTEARLKDPMAPIPTAFDPAAYEPGHFRMLDHGAGRLELLDPTSWDGLVTPAPNLFVPAPGTPLRITHLQPPITRTWGEADGEGVTIRVDSTARPAAPVVRYVVPTFGWDTSSDGGTTTSTRHGRGLRVYLERPWWSSGEGELLGVLLWAAAEAADGNPPVDPDLHQTHPLYPYATQWGEDPLFDAGALPRRHPRLADLTNRVGTENPQGRYAVDGTTTLVDDEMVVVAGHEVAYDPDRQLWFSDIVLEAGTAYTPFIRLALARFQPHSLAGCHLSPVVLAEFAQLAPDRAASVVVSREDPTQVQVSLTGPGPEELDTDIPRGRVLVTVEERRPNPGLYPDDELTWTPVSAPVELSGTREGQSTTWSGRIELPSTTTVQEYRFSFEEFETHLLEPLTGGGTPGVGGRLVHGDSIVVVAGGPGRNDGPGGGGPSGPAPVFQEPTEELPDIGEIYEVEVNHLEFGPGPVIEELATSIGQVVVELLEVAGQGTLRVEVNPEGGMQAPAGVTIGDVVDVSTQGITHQGATITMPAGGGFGAANGLGVRMFHGGAAFTDVTTGLEGDQVSGFSVVLSPFGVGEYTGLQRHAGAGRVETAAAIAAASFAPGVPRVYLATAGDFPDALTAGPKAAAEGAPILLVGDTFPTATAEEVARLLPGEVVLLGGEAAIGVEVERQVRETFPELTVRRVAGTSRFATAAAVSAEAYPAGADVAYLTTGEAFPDALCGGPAALRDGGPVLLVSSDSLPAETEGELMRLGPTRVVVLGGEAAVSAAVAEQVADLTGASVQRLAGPDRYATSAVVASSFQGPRTVFLATGEDFPDALAGVPATAGDGAVMLLTRPTELPPSTIDLLTRLDPDRIVVLGGDAAVGVALEAQLAQHLLD